MTSPDSGLSVLQITDTHLFPAAGETLLGVCTQASLDAVLDHALSTRRPDIIVVTGDIAQVGEARTYARFAASIRRRFDGPVLSVPGNHDLGRLLDEQLGTVATDLVTAKRWSLVGVDTHVDNRICGHVEPAEMLRLEGVLAECAGFVLVVGHHAPVDVHTSWLDEQKIDNGAELVALLQRYNVRGYVFGHVHQAFESHVGDLRIFSTPSTCFQFLAGTDEFQIDTALPGYRWLQLRPDGSIATEVARLKDFHLTLDLTDTKY